MGEDKSQFRGGGLGDCAVARSFLYNQYFNLPRSSAPHGYVFLESTELSRFWLCAQEVHSNKRDKSQFRGGGLGDCAVVRSFLYNQYFNLPRSSAPHGYCLESTELSRFSLCAQEVHSNKRRTSPSFGVGVWATVQ